MCWLCDHPRATRRDYLEHVRTLIESNGWVVQALQRDGAYAPWAYTVGLTRAGLPELVVTGMPVSRAQALLNHLASHFLHADVPEPGEQIALSGGPLIEIVEMAEPAARLITAVEFYGTKIRALQVVHADDRGHWPWEVGYRGVRGGQPVFGARPASAA
jgi:hypothetical protein